MMPARSTVLLTTAAVAAALVVTSPAASSADRPRPGGQAPGAPGDKATWTPADKHGFGTSRTLDSEVWFTLRPGQLSEIFYPDLGTPALRDLEFVVTDGKGLAERTSQASSEVRADDAKVPAFTQTDTSPTGRWRMERRYITDPARDTVLVDVTFRSLTGRPYRVYAVADPNLTNEGDDDHAAVRRGDVVAWDESSAMSLRSDRPLVNGSVGFLGTSDLRTDLAADGDQDATWTQADAGNVVLGARLAGVTGVGRGNNNAAHLALGFGSDAAAARQAAAGSLRAGFEKAGRSYADGWHGYADGLRRAPQSTSGLTDAYWASVVVNAASEDKRNRGAFIASPTMPWVWGHEIEGLSSPSAAYHLVWSRDLYQHATALIAAGDTAAAQRALDFLLFRQQLPDGSFPQNSDVEGRMVWDNLQLDEVALPLVLAQQLGRSDSRTYEAVKRSADFLLSFTRSDDFGPHSAPWSPQERWENQSGFSPGTIAAEIAGLICAADIARKVGDTASANRWLATAHDWADRVEGWTKTTTGPLDPDPYYLRLTKDGNPNSGATYNVGDGGGTYDQRRVVDPSFLELVRLGIKPADDAVIRNTIEVVDRELGYTTPDGRQFWHRFTDDGYGEDAQGGPWRLGTPNEQATIGRVWPIFAGERGEYELLAGEGNPLDRLRDMAAAANDGGMVAEQVWDEHPPSGSPGFTPGEGTFSATPLTWSHAQLVRLAWSIDAGEPVERPAVVTCELLRERC